MIQTPEDPKCTLTDTELIEACNNWVHKLAETRGEAWRLTIPVNFNKDPDMLFIELGKRLAASHLKAKEAAENAWEAHRKYSMDYDKWARNPNAIALPDTPNKEQYLSKEFPTIK